MPRMPLRGGADLVGHGGQEAALGQIRRLRLLLGQAEFRLVHPGGADILDDGPDAGPPFPILDQHAVQAQRDGAAVLAHIFLFVGAVAAGALQAVQLPQFVGFVPLRGEGPVVDGLQLRLGIAADFAEGFVEFEVTPVHVGQGDAQGRQFVEAAQFLLAGPQYALGLDPAGQQGHDQQHREHAHRHVAPQQEEADPRVPDVEGAVARRRAEGGAQGEEQGADHPAGVAEAQGGPGHQGQGHEGQRQAAAVVEVVQEGQPDDQAGNHGPQHPFLAVLFDLVKTAAAQGQDQGRCQQDAHGIPQPPGQPGPGHRRQGQKTGQMQTEHAPRGG